jgi:hypothetical protein
MKLLVASTAVVVFYSGIGMAQMPGDKPAAAEPPRATIVTGNEYKHVREADARHCLAQTNDRAIIRCAEKYRYARGYRTRGT